jgi:hypothetical protein
MLNEWTACNAIRHPQDYPYLRLLETYEYTCILYTRVRVNLYIANIVCIVVHICIQTIPIGEDTGNPVDAE